MITILPKLLLQNEFSRKNNKVHVVFRAPAFRAKASGVQCRQRRKFKDTGSPVKTPMSGLKAVVQTVGGQ